MRSRGSYPFSHLSLTSGEHSVNMPETQVGRVWEESYEIYEGIGLFHWHEREKKKKRCLQIFETSRVKRRAPLGASGRRAPAQVVRSVSGPPGGSFARQSVRLMMVTGCWWQWVLPESSAGLPGSLAGVPNVSLKREQPIDRAHCWLGAELDLERVGGASSSQAGPGT